VTEHDRLTDEILDVWSKSDGAAYQKAAKEIMANRVYVNRLREGLKQIAEERVLAPITAKTLLEESYKL